MLNFRNRGSLKILGDIKINGTPIKSLDSIASISGYVQQDDLFIGSMTVREHLIFQAMLRMNKNASKQERMDRVNKVIDDVKASHSLSYYFYFIA